MVVGVTAGYVIELKMIGVGYRGEMRGKTLILNLGFSHQILFVAPDGVDIKVDPKASLITISGINKELVGESAAKIRKFRPPEPYKGKGVRYKDEIVKTKAGKTAGA